MNPIQCHDELKNLVVDEGFATGKHPKITQEEVNTLNYKLTEDYLKEHLDAEMFTFKTYLELASQAGRLSQAKNFIITQAKKHQEYNDLKQIANLILEDEIAGGGK